MAVVAGDAVEITYNHPVLGTGTWFPKAGEDTTFNPGGFRVNDDANNTDGGGRFIKKLNRVIWSFEGTVSWDANVTDELTQAKKLAAHAADADWTVQCGNGTVWSGKGTVIGDIQGEGNEGTMEIKIGGGRELKKIRG